MSRYSVFIPNDKNNSSGLDQHSELKQKKDRFAIDLKTDTSFSFNQNYDKDFDTSSDNFEQTSSDSSQDSSDKYGKWDRKSTSIEHDIRNKSEPKMTTDKKLNYKPRVAKYDLPESYSKNFRPTNIQKTFRPDYNKNGDSFTETEIDTDISRRVYNRNPDNCLPDNLLDNDVQIKKCLLAECSTVHNSTDVKVFIFVISFFLIA